MRKLLAQSPFVIGAALSVVVHGSALGVLSQRRLWQEDKAPDAVKVRIVETPKPVEPPPPPPPKPPEIKPPKKPVEKKIASERVPKTPPPKDPPKPIQGLSEDSFDKTGKGSVSAPMGNTLMTEDEGIRVKEPPPPMDVDLSADPILIRESMATPQYTDAALDAGFEGVVTVEVLVDEAGQVTQAELTRKVGYGMDQRIVDAARAARFKPRQNKLGRAEAGWTSIKFNMLIQ